MSQLALNTHTHRLTDLPGEKHPLKCQLCGGTNGRHGIPGIIRHSVDRWQEHDHHDKPEPRVIVLCDKCARRCIEPHPRLYNQLQDNQPWPGCMELCVNCKHRSGVSCTHPSAKANGGPGVLITITKPISAMVDGAKYRGHMQLWPKPPEACKQFETA